MNAARSNRTEERTARAGAVLLVWLANLAAGTAIAVGYLADDSGAPSSIVALYVLAGVASAVLLLSLAPLGVCALLARVVSGERAFRAAQASAWTLALVLLYTDTRIYRLFHYHFNGSGWNLITARGAEDSYRLGSSIWIAAAALSSSIFAAEYFVARCAASRSVSARAQHRRAAGWPLRVWAVLLAAPFALECAIHGVVGLARDRELDEYSRAFPIDARAELASWLAPWVAEASERPPRPLVEQRAAPLVYPLQPLTLDPRGARPDILVLVIDSWRRDMLAADVTPGLERFARSSRRFEDHLSGGNATRFGLFTLFYGLHGNYWWSMLAEHRPPVLFDELERAGYDLRVYSSASTDYPEFRQSAFAALGARVIDQFGTPRPSERDERLADQCIGWWNERLASGVVRPSFTFVLLDSPHQVYDFPDDDAPFRPYAPELDYLEMAGSNDPQLVLRVENRYKNAVHHADRVATRLFDALAANGTLDRTLVIVTGDHGEEFAEHGYWGHTSNFSAEQARVPFLMRGPLVAPGVERRPTSHLDLACTLLERLGVDPRERANYTVGENLLAPLAQRDRSVAAWQELGLWTSSGILRLPFGDSGREPLEVRNFDWRLAADPSEALAREREALGRLADECRRFVEPHRALAHVGG